MEIKTPVYIFEYDIPMDQARFLNKAPGIWFWILAPGAIVVTDDNGHTGYYDTTNAIKYNIKSARESGTDLMPVESFNDCYSVAGSFYYDNDTSGIYFHFLNSEPPLAQKITIGLPVGYSQNCINIKPYFYGIYYPPRISKISDIKKTMDRMFYGVSKYSTAKVTLINTDGDLDDFGSRNLFNQPCRILKGDEDTDYLNYQTVTSGFIGDYTYNHEEIEIEMDDPRKGLTQPVARNTLNKTDYPYLSDSNVDAAKPVIFGACFNVPVICLNEEETTVNYNFLLCDDEFFDSDYYISSIANVYCNGIAVSTYTRSGNILTIAGNYDLGDDTVADNLDSVVCDITMTIINGVDIIKYLMKYYDGKPYVESFWNIFEVDSAQLLSLNTGIYVDDSSEKLADIISDVCNDISARFFVNWNGKYTIRLYDNDRLSAAQINDSLWLGTPSIKNNGSEYLTSCVIKYQKQIDDDDYAAQYEETTYKETAYNTYKKYNVETYETNLPDLASATEKGQNIMVQSYSIGDIVTRPMIMDDGTNNFGDILDLGDFIVANPEKRIFLDEYGDKKYLYDTTTANALRRYEILSLTKKLDDNKLQLTMRYIGTGDFGYHFELDYDEERITDYDNDPVIVKGA